MRRLERWTAAGAAAATVALAVAAAPASAEPDPSACAGQSVRLVAQVFKPSGAPGVGNAYEAFGGGTQEIGPGMQQLGQCRSRPD